MDPLSVLRDFVSSGRKWAVDGDEVVFGDLRFRKEEQTAWKAAGGRRGMYTYTHGKKKGKSQASIVIHIHTHTHIYPQHRLLQTKRTDRPGRKRRPPLLTIREKMWGIKSDILRRKA